MRMTEEERRLIDEAGRGYPDDRIVQDGAAGFLREGRFGMAAAEDRGGAARPDTGR